MYDTPIVFQQTEAGLRAVLEEKYGDCHSIRIEENKVYIQVPPPEIGCWIGRGASIARTLAVIFGVYQAVIEPFPEDNSQP